MRHARNVVVGRPADEVYAYLADARNDVEWRAVTTSEPLDGGAPGVSGTQYRQTLVARGGDEAFTVETLTADERHRTVTYRVLDDPTVALTSSFLVRPVSPTTAEVHLVLDVEPRGWWRRALAPLRGPQLRRQTILYLASLQHALERDEQDGPPRPDDDHDHDDDHDGGADGE